MLETLIPLAGGGLLGFAVGYAIKKILKLALIAIGILILFLGYLEYNKWISPNWTIIENQTQGMMTHILGTANTITQHIGREIPIGLGLIGFIPGLAIGLLKG